MITVSATARSHSSHQRNPRAGGVEGEALRKNPNPVLEAPDDQTGAAETNLYLKEHTMSIQELTDLINRFVSDKGWYEATSRFPQTPRNIATSVAIEAAELLEHFQFTDTPDDRAALADELADVANYLFQLAYLLEIDLEQAILNKLRYNYDRTWE
jgi:NTP pyrophosphatase (non-canonical NTP hydrolase)